MTDQKSYGIHLRLRARAFMFYDGTTTLTFVNLDACMATQAVKNVTMEKLRMQSKITTQLHLTQALQSSSFPLALLLKRM